MKEEKRVFAVKNPGNFGGKNPIPGESGFYHNRV